MRNASREKGGGDTPVKNVKKELLISVGSACLLISTVFAYVRF